mgnify:CR=1 FL=1
MIIFYNPADGQVMATYSMDTDSTAWTEQGFTRAEVPDGLVADIRTYRRECKVTVNGDGVITGVESQVNDIQPVPNADEISQAELRASGRAKLMALGLTEDEIKAI